MNIIIANGSEEPIYEQIARQLRRQIVEGVLAAGEALPSIRVLAAALRVSVITTKRAYEELEREGFVHGEPGRGTFVASLDHAVRRERIAAELESRLGAIVAEAEAHGIGLGELHTMIDLVSGKEEP